MPTLTLKLCEKIFNLLREKLNNGDLVINGIEIRGAREEDDERSVSISSSSRKDSSAIALATAINSHSEETGVEAQIVSGKIAGTSTNTGFPGCFSNRRL